MRNRPADFHVTRRNAREYDRAQVVATADSLVGSYRWRATYGRDGAMVCELAVVVGVEGEGAAMRLVLRGNGRTRRVGASTFACEWFKPQSSDPVLALPVVLAGGRLVWPSN